jgi:benzoyl-CoA reductase/2-hydroxyglutaryl-CoA dehydratase subunit BcrC/BadD/HgdB
LITVAYSSPFVPVEWIAAHGLRPFRLLPGPAGDAAEPVAGLRQGLCPFAAACVTDIRDRSGPMRSPATQRVDAAVFATTCDQMRRAPELLEFGSNVPIFVLNIPATWQGPAKAAMYRDELLRLGRFLLRLGGAAPKEGELADRRDAGDPFLLASLRGFGRR